MPSSFFDNARMLAPRQVLRTETDGGWRRLNWRALRQRVGAVGQALLNLDLSLHKPPDPAMVYASDAKTYGPALHDAGIQAMAVFSKGANQQMLAQTLRFLGEENAGAARLAALEPHLRPQPQHQPGAAHRGHAVHRRRTADTGCHRQDDSTPAARTRKLELRVKGDHIFPGYRNTEAATRGAFDDDGYSCIGDAGYLADANGPAQGTVFNGRVAEDFKLTSGTWVSVGTLRVRVRVRVRMVSGLAPLCRTLWSPLADNPSMAAGEITDKGYVNQRLVLSRRAADVAALYASPAEPRVVIAHSTKAT